MNTIRTTQSSDAIARSLYMSQQAKAEQLYDDMAKTFWPMIGTANQCAYLAMDDAVDAMQAEGILRQQLKVKANAALKEFRRYEKAVFQHFSSMGDDRYYLWADLVSHAADDLESDVQKLYFAIKNVLDRNNVERSDMHAKIQTAAALIDLSVLMYDTMAEQFQRQTMIPIASSFDGGRLTSVQSNWKAVGYITGRKVLPSVDLNKDPQCHMAVRVILTRYQRVEFLNKAAGEALKLNPNCEKYLNEEPNE